jgi:DNA-binding NtrC family response regulator
VAAARVLIVDDEEFYLDTLSRRLHREGYDVLSASGPREALELIRTSAPIDVVLSDIQMPEVHGTDLVCEVAQASPLSACLLMTGGLTALLDAPDGVPILRKPIRTADLLAAVEKACKHSAQLRANHRAYIERAVERRAQAEWLWSECEDVRRETSKTVQRSRRLKRRRNPIPGGPVQMSFDLAKK